MNRILVIIGMQNDFISASSACKYSKLLVPNIVKEIKKSIMDEENIFLTQDTHGRDYLSTQEGFYNPVPHCILGTNGWEIIDDIWNALDTALNKYIRVVSKPTFGSIELVSKIKLAVKSSKDVIEHIDIVGVHSDTCVISNALLLKANFKDIKINVISDASGGTSIEAHEAALIVLDSCQCNVITTEELNQRR